MSTKQRVTTWLVRSPKMDGTPGYYANHGQGWFLVGPPEREEAWHFDKEDAEEFVHRAKADGTEAKVVRWTRTVCFAD